MSSLDPSSKLYRETLCEHDKIDWHYYPAYHDETMKCLGGSREEVTIDYEAAQERMDVLLGYFNPDVRVGEIHIEANPIVDAAFKSAGFTKKFASGESPTE